jgi:peptidoglycan hydrolase CwlO-like protein
MCRKILVGGAVVGTLAFVLMGPQAVYHVKRAFNWAKSEVQDAVPVHYQLEQAEDMIRDLGPEIEDWERKVVEEEVAIDQLKRSIQNLEEDLARLADRIQRNNGRLKGLEDGEVTEVSLAGRTYSRNTLAHRVRLDLAKHRQGADLLDSQRRLLENRADALTMAQAKVDGVKGERQELQIRVEQLRAQLRQNEAIAATAEHPLDVDDSRLAEVKRILERCRTRIEVDRRLLDRQGVTFGDDGDEPVSVPDVVEEVETYFGTSNRSARLVPAVSGN